MGTLIFTDWTLISASKFGVAAFRQMPVQSRFLVFVSALPLTYWIVSKKARSEIRPRRVLESKLKSNPTYGSGIVFRLLFFVSLSKVRINP